MKNDKKTKKEFAKVLAVWVLSVYGIYMFMISIFGFVNPLFPIVGILTATVAIPIGVIASYYGKAGYENGKKIYYSYNNSNSLETPIVTNDNNNENLPI